MPITIEDTRGCQSVAHILLHLRFQELFTQAPLFNSQPKKMVQDFPGGPVVENSSCDAGDTGSISGGKTNIVHATGQLSPGAITTEATTKYLVCCN